MILSFIIVCIFYKLYIGVCIGTNRVKLYKRFEIISNADKYLVNNQQICIIGIGSLHNIFYVYNNAIIKHFI